MIDPPSQVIYQATRTAKSIIPFNLLQKYFPSSALDREREREKNCPEWNRRKKNSNHFPPPSVIFHVWGGRGGCVCVCVGEGGWEVWKGGLGRYYYYAFQLNSLFERACWMQNHGRHYSLLFLKSPLSWFSHSNAHVWNLLHPQMKKKNETRDEEDICTEKIINIYLYLCIFIYLSMYIYIYMYIPSCIYQSCMCVYSFLIFAETVDLSNWIFPFCEMVIYAASV